MLSEKSRPSESSHFRPDVEGLRAIAILLVVLYHAGVPLVTGGYVGVDVFFVLSGYLITGLLVNEIQAKGKLDFLRFYARRARRLLPAAALVLVVTLCVAQLLLGPQELKKLANSAVATSLYISNLWFAHTATDYLASDAETNALLHTWSLSVEEQFYFFWPLFVLLAYRGFRGARVNLRRLVIWMGAVLALSLAASVVLTEIAQPWAFFGSPMRAWEFAIGGLACLVPMAWMQARPGLAKGLSWLGLALIAGATFRFNANTEFPGAMALIPSLGTALVLLSFYPQRRDWLMRGLNSGPMQWMGSRSYSWYLWHWPVLVLAGIYFGRHELTLSLACLALSLFLASLSYHFFENPIRFHPRLVPKPAFTLGLACVLTLAATGSSGYWRHAAGVEAKSPVQLPFTRATRDVPGIYASDCHRDYLTTEPANCEYGDLHATTTVALLGDSHAAQWFPAMEALAKQQHWKLLLATKSSCAAAAVVPYNKRLGRPYLECAQWRERVFAKFAEVKPDLVVIGHARYVHDAPNAAGGTAETDDAASGDDSVSAEEWEQGMKETLTRLEQIGAATAIIRDTPWPGFNVPNCLARQTKASWNGLQCEYRLQDSIQSTEYEINQRVARQFKGVFFVDMNDWVCKTAVCPVIDPESGIVLYRDSHHLTTEYVMHIVPEFFKQLKPMMRQLAQVENPNLPN